MATRASSGGKRDFAKRARDFVDATPGFPMLWVVGAAAVALMIVTGGFHTGMMPVGQRSALWLLLIGWNVAKWQMWFAWMVRRPQDWTRTALIGTVLLNLPLPIEIALALRAVGVADAPAAGGIWLTALAISGVIFAVALTVRKRAEPPPAPPSPAGPLARALVVPADLAAIEAEDHYCRLRRADGSSALIHARFADVLADVAALDGLQVHRGAWVAAGAVTGAERDGRRWLLTLADGHRVPVSATHAAAVRARGWLRSRVAFAPAGG